MCYILQMYIYILYIYFICICSCTWIFHLFNTYVVVQGIHFQWQHRKVTKNDTTGSFLPRSRPDLRVWWCALPPQHSVTHDCEEEKNFNTPPSLTLMPCKNWGAPELNDVGGSCKSFAACWKLKPPGRRRKSLAKPPICIVTSHFFCWKPHSILDPPSAGTPFQWSSLLQLLETSLWSFSGQNSCPCPDLLQLIYIIIPSLCIWIWPHHNWIRFLWSACNRGSSGLRISEFWGFQWQTLAEILSLFVKKVKLFFLKKG